MKTEEKKRPSSLPKLEKCRCYVGGSGTNEAAARGTLLDKIIREKWNCSKNEQYDKLNAEDKESVDFALQTLRDLSLGEHVETREENLKAVSVLEEIADGTKDAQCDALCFTVDFKTGEIRDYRAQMAGYCLAEMGKNDVGDWTAHVVFCDKKQVVSYRFTFDEALAIVKNIIDAPKIESPCEYCSWCDRFKNCPAIEKQALELAAIAEGFSLMEQMLENHERAHYFLTKLSKIEKWSRILKDELKNQLKNTEGESDYFSLSSNGKILRLKTSPNKTKQ